MGCDNTGWIDLVLLQGLLRTVFGMSFDLRSRIAWGGFLGFGLALLFAHYFSQGLHAWYGGLLIWRDQFESDPNQITKFIYFSSLPVFFFTAWWMLWKLDCFWSVEPARQPESLDETDKTAQPSGRKDERDGKENSEEETAEADEQEEESIPKDESFASVNSKPADPLESVFADVLGLEEPFEEEKVKSHYRKLIAQYHPDRVRAMGPEIRDVAESKAKEINEAYEFFRRKFEAKE